MKKLLAILFAAGLAFNASAQKFHPGRPHYRSSRVVVSAGVYAPFYPYYGYYGYPYYAYPFYGYTERPTKLELKIEDIKNDFQDKIWSARHNKNLNGKERRKIIHSLKHERDREIIEAKRDYYK